MPQTPGRNTRLENLWRNISNFFARPFNAPTGQTAPLVGQVGYFSSEDVMSRRYDQEYVETPVRDVYRARQLIGLRARPEVSTALDILVGDILSSEDGDDIGLTVGEFLDVKKIIPVDPRLRQICLDCIDRIMMGSVLTTVAEEFLIYGDSFRSCVLDANCTKILRLKQLPTWEMFRVEDEDGVVFRFDQRKYLGEAMDNLQIHPAICTHWRYRRLYKYGRSMFEEVIPDSDALNQGYFALDKAAMAIGINPNIHVMPQGWTQKQADAYKRSYEIERDRNGRIMTDYFMLNGGDVKKLSATWNPDLKALIDNVLQRRMRIAMRSRIPPWMIGLPTIGAREISGQPALAYARMIGTLRTVLAEGVRQILNLELALNGYTLDQMKYRIEFPRIITDTQVQSGLKNQDGTPTDNNSEAETEVDVEQLDQLSPPSRDFDRFSTFLLESRR